MAANDRLILVTGATGKQGGAVVRQLAGSHFRLRAMTRKLDGDAARALAQGGVQVVAGDLDDADSVKAALTGAWGVFAVQNTWEAGVEREEVQGKRIAQLARETGVEHYVYSSVGSAQRKTGIPHFENKWRVEETVRALRFPSHVIMRPVFFMENLVSPWFMQGDKLTSTLAPDTPLQMVAVEDIGRLGARAFTDAAEMNGHEIDLAGDSLTLPEAASTLARATRRPIEYKRIPIEMVRKNSADLAAMLEWFEKVGYDADIAGVARKYDLHPLTLEQWAKKTLGR